MLPAHRCSRDAKQPGAITVSPVVVVCICALAMAPRSHARWVCALGVRGEQGTAMFSDLASRRSGSSTCVWSSHTTWPASRAPHSSTSTRGWLLRTVQEPGRLWPLLRAGSAAGSFPVLSQLPALYARLPRALSVGLRRLNSWNEANHGSQPTYRHPRRAAGFYNALRRVCRGCNVAAATCSTDET